MANTQALHTIGLMSGTSMDGVDAAYLFTDGEEFIEVGESLFIEYDQEASLLFRLAELAVRDTKGDLKLAAEKLSTSFVVYLRELLALSPEEAQKEGKRLKAWFIKKCPAYSEISLEGVVFLSSEYHLKAVEKLIKKLGAKVKIELIGYHGQTLFHRPSAKITIQVGSAKHLVNNLNITVVDDFRSNDIAHAGQGAPLAPLYHSALVGKEKLTPAVVINCGGIANLTVVTNSTDDLFAYDCGPGNALIDRYVRLKTNGAERCDRDGLYGLEGKVDNELLEKLFHSAIVVQGKNFFEIEPPKSLDSSDMQLVSGLDGLALEDACRTLEAFSAEAMVRQLEYVEQRGIDIPENWILCGGGWENPMILEELRERLASKYKTKFKIQTADQVGWNSASLEAELMAYLAVRSLRGLPLTLPGTTGVIQSVTGGVKHLCQQ